MERCWTQLLYDSNVQLCNASLSKQLLPSYGFAPEVRNLETDNVYETLNRKDKSTITEIFIKNDKASEKVAENIRQLNKTLQRQSFLKVALKHVSKFQGKSGGEVHDFFDASTFTLTVLESKMKSKRPCCRCFLMNIRDCA